MSADPKVWSRATNAHRAGQLDEAASLYAEVLRASPRHAEAFHQLGLLHYQKGRAGEAVALLQAALQIAPDAELLLSNAAVVLNSMKRHAEALTLLDRAVALKPDFGAAHRNRGIVLQAMGRHLEALESFDKALASLPVSVDILCRRGHSLHELTRYHDAVSAYRRALELKPNSALLHFCEGNSQLPLNGAEAAIASFDRALVLQPDYPEACLNRGYALSILNRHQEALAAFERALALRPEFPEALCNRGYTLMELGRYDAAVASCDQALALRPDYAQAHWNKSLVRLLQGHLGEGLREYEWRWKRAEIAASVRAFDQPMWTGETSLQGKTILLHAEQGIGDTLQFVRYVPLVAARGARIVLEVQPPLKPYLSALGGIAQVLAEGDDLPPFDLHCPLLSLPLAFGTTLATIPADVPYLPLSRDLVATWKDRLPRARPLVGITWSGNPAYKADWKRSMAFAQLLPLVSRPGMRFVSLQYGVRETDRPAVEARTDFVGLPEGWHDFAVTAAVISELDLVISVDSAVAHLAGALGKPVWILLPSVPDWRWLLEREDSPWYPTARLFRRRNGDTWDDVIQRVGDALRAKFGGT